MTKLRAPLTFERALVRIADLLGWDACARITGKSVRTVMDWSDPDTGAGVSLEHAYRLDHAYRRAGGDGAPFHDCYRLRLETEQSLSVAEADEFKRRIAAAIKEGGEANAALVLALGPNATAADRALARREVEEAIAAHTSTLALLNEGAGPETAGDERAFPGRETL